MDQTNHIDLPTDNSGSVALLGNILFENSSQVDPDLEMRARRLWPDSDYNRREWLRAVGVVRAHGGWVLEGGGPRQQLSFGRMITQ